MDHHGWTLLFPAEHAWILNDGSPAAGLALEQLDQQSTVMRNQLLPMEAREGSIEDVDQTRIVKRTYQRHIRTLLERIASADRPAGDRVLLIRTCVYTLAARFASAVEVAEQLRSPESYSESRNLPEWTNVPPFQMQLSRTAAVLYDDLVGEAGPDVERLTERITGGVQPCMVVDRQTPQQKQQHRSAWFLKVVQSKGWTRSKLSSQSGVPTTCVYDWLAGRRDLTPAHIMKMAKALDVGQGTIPNKSS